LSADVSNSGFSTLVLSESDSQNYIFDAGLIFHARQIAGNSGLFRNFIKASYARHIVRNSELFRNLIIATYARADYRKFRIISQLYNSILQNPEKQMSKK
jgi:hypothetical protein